MGLNIMQGLFYSTPFGVIKNIHNTNIHRLHLWLIKFKPVGL